MTLRPAPRAATWLLRQFCSNPEDEWVIGDLIEEYQRGRGRVWYWRQVLAIVFLGISRERRQLVSTGRISMGPAFALILIGVALIGVLLSEIGTILLAGILGGVVMGILMFARGNGRKQPLAPDSIAIARIDSSKIPISGGIGAGIVIVILLTGALVELPKLRLLVVPGILAGLLFGGILHSWRKHHAAREKPQGLGLLEDARRPIGRR